jgi:hypothetical protein
MIFVFVVPCSVVPRSCHSTFALIAACALAGAHTGTLLNNAPLDRLQAPTAVQPRSCESVPTFAIAPNRDGFWIACAHLPACPGAALQVCMCAESGRGLNLEVGHTYATRVLSL